MSALDDAAQRFVDACVYASLYNDNFTGTTQTDRLAQASMFMKAEVAALNTAIGVTVAIEDFDAAAVDDTKGFYLTLPEVSEGVIDLTAQSPLGYGTTEEAVTAASATVETDGGVQVVLFASPLKKIRRSDVIVEDVV